MALGGWQHTQTLLSALLARTLQQRAVCLPDEAMATDKREERHAAWREYVSSSNASWREDTSTTPAGTPSGHTALTPRRAEQAHTVAMLRQPHPADKEKMKTRTKVQARRESGEKAAKAAKATTPRQSPGRRRRTPRRSKSPRRSKASAPHSPAPFRDCTSSTPWHENRSHAPTPGTAGHTLLQVVKAETKAAKEPGVPADATAHTATITAALGGQIEMLRAELTAEQTQAMVEQRSAVAKEVQLLEVILAERRIEMAALDEALSTGMAPAPKKTPGRKVSPGRRTRSPARGKRKGGGARSRTPPRRSG